MISFDKDDFQRLSIISSASTKDSIDTQLSIKSKEKKNYCRHILFFGSLILCIILLIIGFILFIKIEQQNKKNIKKDKQRIKLNYSNSNSFDYSKSILCPFNEQITEYTKFALNQLNCGLNNSFLINLYDINDSYSINVGDYLNKTDVMNQPIIELNSEVLSNYNSISFIVILIDATTMGAQIILFWIRYISFSFDDQYDICSMRPIKIGFTENEQKILLLYATNSTLMMIRAKTICNKQYQNFQLIDYIHFINLKLIASTFFFIKYHQDHYIQDQE